MDELSPRVRLLVTTTSRNWFFPESETTDLVISLVSESGKLSSEFPEKPIIKV